MNYWVRLNYLIDLVEIWEQACKCRCDPCLHLASEFWAMLEEDE